ncbi:MAG: M23 family metallopeptidase [Actinomycetota bacterium]
MSSLHAVPARGSRRRSGRLAATVAAVTLVALIGSACGQFPQARREAAVHAAELRAKQAAAVATPTPAASTQVQQNSGRTTYGSYDSPVQAPKNPAITGGHSTVNFSKFFPATRPVNKGSRHQGTSDSGSGTGSNSASKNGSGSKKTSGSRGDRGTGTTTKKSSTGENGAKPGNPAIKGRIQQRRPVSIPKLAQLVSREMRRGAQYNSKILPAGFPFTICPVWGRYAYSDSYGAPRYAGGYHPHAGNDIFANRGTPILAPFNGIATRVPNTLGGNAVEVHGAQGYVYNAHLTAYGLTGKVTAGDVIGFVGNTGDAQGGATHDHFEWHPYNVQSYDRVIAGTNGAVDPFPYLQVVCPPQP